MIKTFTEIRDLVDEIKGKKFAVGETFVVFKVAGKSAVIPGSINVTDGRGFDAGKWWGRIVKQEEDRAIFKPSRDCPTSIFKFIHIFMQDPVVVSYSRI